MKKQQPKGNFDDLLEKVRYECWFMNWCVRVVMNFWKLLWEFSWCCWTKKCEIVLIISSSTDYKFSAAFFIFMALMWNVYYYHEMLVDIGREENYKRLVAYGFHSLQINWCLTPRGEQLFMKTSIAYRLLPICPWSSYDPSSN